MTTLLLPLLLTVAHAGTLYVNGVRAETLRSFDFSQVDVKIDANGDIWVTAPQYRIELAAPGTPGGAPTANAAPAAAPAPFGTYWLVTEDNQSTGHIVEVRVNGELVKKIQSGEEQVIFDLGKYLTVGANTVVIDALPTRDIGGGVFSVYISTGSNEDGTLKLDRPVIDFSRRSTDSAAGASRSYELVVK